MEKLDMTSSESSESPVLPAVGKARERLLSLDVLRGFDMFWIIGGTQLVVELIKYLQKPWLAPIEAQMRHVKWEGFHFHDLIFPLFLFISGVTIPFSIQSKLNKGVSCKRFYLHFVKRLVLLVLLGLVYNGGLKFQGVSDTRFASVLGLIGIGTFFAAILTLHIRKIKWLLAIFAFILVSYWAMLMFIPVPDIGAGVLTPGGNFAGFVDRVLLPGRVYRKVYDPEGILACYSGISMAMAGVITGLWLRTDREPWHKALGLLIGGIVCLLSAKIWAIQYPMIKSIWTGTFILYAAGWSLLLLCLFYVVIDIWKIRRWAWPFILVGVNPITIYMGAKIIDFRHTADFLFGGAVGLLDIPVRPVMMVLAILLCELFFLFVLYRKKIFLKV